MYIVLSAIVKNYFKKYDPGANVKTALGEGVNPVTSTEARRILSVEGRPINDRTFQKLIDAGIVEISGYFAGKRIFQRNELEKLVPYLPKKRPPSHSGIVNHVKAALKSKKKLFRNS